MNNWRIIANSLVRIKFLIQLLIINYSLFIITSCEDKFDNPFDDPSIKAPEENPDNNPIPATSFAGLHQNIFIKTCANSGCHDGNFEPDFRTIESAYNTLVFQPVIKNNLQGTFEYRVKPNDADASILIERLVRDIDGFSGIMPLALDPGSDWDSRKNEYINNIRIWINEGAKDVFGNPAKQGNAAPQMRGAVAFLNGNPINRTNVEFIEIAAGTTNLELFLSLQDDLTPVQNLTYNKIKFSTDINDFASQTEMNLTVLSNPISAEGLFEMPENFYHKININPSLLGVAGDVIYFRVYVQDADNPLTEIPNIGSFQYIKEYFAIKLI